MDMALTRILTKAGATAIVALAMAFPAAAKPTPVRVLQTWTGRVPLAVQPPLQSSLVNPEALRQLWALCQVKGEAPKIDFDKHLVLVAVRRGSAVRFQKLQLADGNLRTDVAVTPDMPAYMTCALALVDRAGIAKVNGMPVGQ